MSEIGHSQVAFIRGGIHAASLLLFHGDQTTMTLLERIPLRTEITCCNAGCEEPMQELTSHQELEHSPNVVLPASTAQAIHGKQE